MTRAAPGVFARGRLRRKLPEYLEESDGSTARCWSKFLYRRGMVRDLHPNGNGPKKCGIFTQDLSGNGVGCGRLGEVVSLVGDCRPPPPGNPRRPSYVGCRNPAGSRQTSSVEMDRGKRLFSSKMRNYGGVFLSVCIHSSFNDILKKGILKNLNHIEYFKKTRSSFYCIWKKPVLEFEHLHSHLCGFKGVESLSIAITNVLEM
jgi:hypothetical protein